MNGSSSNENAKRTVKSSTKRKRNEKKELTTKDKKMREKRLAINRLAAKESRRKQEERMKFLEEEVKYLKEINLQNAATIATYKAMLDRQPQDSTVSTPIPPIGININNSVVTTTRAVTFPPGIIYLIQQQSQDPMQELIRHESIRREIQNVNRVHLTP